jgi:hypothetical protein
LATDFREDDELGAPMAPVVMLMDLAAGHRRCSEQAGDAVAQVIMSHAGGHIGVHYNNIAQLLMQANSAEMPVRHVRLEAAALQLSPETIAELDAIANSPKR